MEDVQANFETLDVWAINNPITAADISNAFKVAPLGWTAPTLLNSWTNFGGSLEPAGYLKDPLGFVHLRGVSSRLVLLALRRSRLPAGYRPGADYVASVCI